MFEVYELVRFLLANKRQTVRCDWLAVVNIMAAEWMDACCVDYANYTSPFYLYIIHNCTQTDFGGLRFRLQAIKQITAAARRRRLLSPAISAILLSNKCCRVWHKCLPTNVSQQLLGAVVQMP